MNHLVASVAEEDGVLVEILMKELLDTLVVLMKAMLKMLDILLGVLWVV